ncbi:MAG TPA: Ig-like domain-containing protein [Planctomycetota bacterium]|nr:Ig-like domain-containing protein [Planctomycetota bacterium]
MNPRHVASALALLFLAVPAYAHEYFVNGQKVHPGDTLSLAVGKPTTIDVDDAGSCKAIVTALIADTSIATVTPATKTGVETSFSVTGLTFGSTTITFHVQGVGKDKQGMSCGENSMNVFTLCMAPNPADSVKQFKDAAKVTLKELKDGLKQRTVDLAAQNAQVLQNVASGVLSHASAAQQLGKNTATALAGLNNFWDQKTQELTAAGKAILAARQFPSCAPVPPDFSFGASGVWQDYLDASSAEVKKTAVKMNQLLEGELKTWEKIPPGVGSPGPGLIAVTNRTLLPENLVVFGPASEDPLPTLPSKPVIIVGTTGVRATTGSTGTLTVSGLGQPTATVHVAIDGAGSATADPVVDANGNWSTTFSGLTAGDYVVRASYAGDTNVAATLATIR